jgi:hypothetical protein
MPTTRTSVLQGREHVSRTCPHCAYRFLRHLAYRPKCGSAANG